MNVNASFGHPLPDGRVTATYIPPGRWSVAVEPRDSGWAAVATPLGHNGAGFDIAEGPNLEAAVKAGRSWVNSATVFPLPTDRAVFVGVVRRMPEAVAA